ncbi:MAG TPA: hypothetical protein VFZ73_13735, partial [Gemmatimonadaceae bacterium]
ASRARTWEIRVPSGSFITTGAQGNQLKNAHLTAIQLSRVIGPHLALTGTFTWARSRDLTTAGSPKLDVFTSDVGVEVRSREWAAGRRVSLSTFAGIGAGARSYDYVKLEAGARNNLAGYAGAGGEIGVGRVALRIEARNYTTGFKPLAGAGKSDTRNDMVVMAAVRFNRRSPETR